MKKLLIALMLALACVAGCKTDKPNKFPDNPPNNEFYTDVTYVGYAEGSGT